MKRILGLDLGTNSIGWALVDSEEQRILGMGSRIIPMDQGVLDTFSGGESGRDSNSCANGLSWHTPIARKSIITS